jgi:LysM repeat protein
VNSFKSFCMLLVLVGIGYGVYRSLHLKNPQPATASVDPSIPEIEVSFGPSPGANQADSVTNSTPPRYELGSNPGLTPPPSNDSAGSPKLLLPNDSTAARPGPTPPAFVPGGTTSAETTDPMSASGALLPPLNKTDAPAPMQPPPALPPLRSSTPADSIAVTPAADAIKPGELAKPTGTTPAIPTIDLQTTPVKPVVSHVETPNLGGLSPFPNILRDTQQLIAEGKYAQALRRLTPAVNEDKLTPAEQTQMMELLNQLAGSVIYSRDDHLEQAYIVRSGETLQSIADQYQVPWEMLAKINGLTSPSQIQAGEKLKVVRGPFRAEVNLTKQRVTLYLRDLYAGTFPVLNIGSDQSVSTGEFTVVKRERLPEYKGQPQLDTTGNRVAVPTNPLGEFCIDLGNGIKLHGHGAQVVPNDPQGSIRLSPQDSEDLHDILSQGSAITIRR